jgi:hypothetical protein
MVQDKNYGTEKLKDTEITRAHKEKIRKGIIENSEQRNNQNEETHKTKWQNIKKVVTIVACEVVQYEERKKKNDWYEDEPHIKVEERYKAQIIMLNRKRMNTENYKTKRREAKKMH